MVNILVSLCVLYNLPGPPSVMFQNGTYQLYPIYRRLCSNIDPYRDNVFELYTRDNSENPHILRTGEDDLIANSTINFKNPTVIFFHGYLESSKSDDAVKIKTNYLKRGKYNVILVNNERLLAGPYYIGASLNVEPIGKFSAKFIDYLVTKGLHLSDLHIIGMSLGAHSAGITGKNIHSGKPRRITGLDPANPFFNLLSSGNRLYKDDAEFVDVIHTNAGLFGFKYACGDVDIWVNGGSRQPGCSVTETLKRAPPSWALAELGFCNHYQAYRVYVMSLINPTEYVAKKCRNYVEYKNGNCNSNEKTYVGVDVDPTARGNYYIKTGVTAVNI